MGKFDITNAYKKYGEETNFSVNGNIHKFSDLTDSEIKICIVILTNEIKEYDMDLVTTWNNSIIDVANDVLIKRRINKINNIKEKIYENKIK